MKTIAFVAIAAGIGVASVIGALIGIEAYHQEQVEAENKAVMDVFKKIGKEQKITPSIPDETPLAKPISPPQTPAPDKSHATILPEEDEKTSPQSNNCSGKAGCFSEYVTRIVDGDTIYTDTLKIRLSLTNTPEKDENGYAQATEFTRKLCPVGSKILIDQDDLQPVDVYGRVLAKVYCGDKVLNSELLYNNYANILTRYCSTSEFSDEDWAKRNGC